MGSIGLLRLLPKTDSDDQLEELRVGAARVHPMVHRLQAEAELEYGQRKNSLHYVLGYLREMGVFIDDASAFLDWLSDQQADLGMAGNFALPEARRRMKFFQGVVQRLEAQEALKKLPRGA